MVFGNIHLKGTRYQVLLFLCYWLLRTCRESSFLCLMPLPWWAMVPQTKDTAISSSPWLWTEVIHFSSYADCLCPFCYNRELPNTRHELCAQPPLKEASGGPFVNQLRQHSAVRRVNFPKATISYAVFFYFFSLFFFYTVICVTLKVWKYQCHHLEEKIYLFVCLLFHSSHPVSIPGALNLAVGTQQ